MELQNQVRAGQRHGLSLAAACAVVCLLAAAPGRADVTITPGTIHGTVAFTADLVPSSMQVDAVNPPSEGTQYPSTVTVTAPCSPSQAAGTLTTSYWCYSITVELALTSAYYIRPIFYYDNGAGTSGQIALPEFPQPPATIAITPNGDVEYDLWYEPAIVQGATGLSSSGQSLPGVTFDLIAHDDDANSLIYPDPACGPSIGGNCLANSTVNTNAEEYEVYLKPGRAYSLQSGFGWSRPPSRRRRKALIHLISTFLIKPAPPARSRLRPARRP